MPRTKIKGSGSVSAGKRIKASSKKLPSIKVSVPTRRVEKGKMNIDTEQMIKDLVELGRMKENKKDNIKERLHSKKSANSFVDLSNSPLVNFIQEKNHGSYFRVALVFLSIVVLFFLSILYVINSKAVINIVLKKTDSTSQIQRTFNIYDISELSKTNNSVIVVSVPTAVSLNDSYAISSQIVKTEKAEGKIRITNNTTKDQVLISSTRFVSDVSGDLYRLKNTVNVLANSSVEAFVYADKVTTSGESIGTRLTIPGLKSEEVRKAIYGESISEINHNGVVKTIVKEEDISKAKNILEVKLRQATIVSLQEKVSAYSDFVMLSDSLNFKVTSSSLDGAKVGQEVNSIKMSGKAEVTALFVNRKKLLDVIKSNILSQNVSSNIVKIKEPTLNYSLYKMDLINQLVSLNISVDNYISYNAEQMLSREDIVGMDIDDFYIYANDKNFASRIQVVSYPFWNNSLPKISDNITIRVK